jgi:hypothetical protein
MVVLQATMDYWLSITPEYRSKTYFIPQKMIGRAIQHNIVLFYAKYILITVIFKGLFVSSEQTGTNSILVIMAVCNFQLRADKNNLEQRPPSLKFRGSFSPVHFTPFMSHFCERVIWSQGAFHLSFRALFPQYASCNCVSHCTS